MAYIPIWRDAVVQLPYNDQDFFTEFRVAIGTDASAFLGRAYNRPDPSTGEFTLGPTVLLNDIVADYLRQTFIADLSSPEDAWLPPLSVQVQLYTGNVKRSDDVFLLDWSYDYGRNAATGPMHDPVDGRLDGRQHFIQTSRSAYNIGFYFNGSQVVTVQGGPGNFFLDLKPLSQDYTSVLVQGVTYTIDQERCADRFVLHYANAFGGWDSLLMSGQSVKSYGYDRKRFSYDHRNDDNLNPGSLRGTKDYVNVIEPSWSLRSGLMNDEQSARMHHLLGSVLVYLEDLTTGEFFPVVLTDSSHTVQTVNGNNRRPIQYTINVKLAAERVRR